MMVWPVIRYGASVSGGKVIFYALTLFKIEQ